ncbi:MAG TPA: fibronectin type III domain-containing protein [Bacteroidia bacterium]|nr:fibronectin type III domain-containing protein [Bacteroidia bacterium]
MKNKFCFTSLIVALVFGISQVCAQTNCPTPSSLTSSNITSNSATLSWNTVANNAFYNVRYRVSTNTTWQTITTQTSSVNLTNLLCNSNYEWQVQSACPTGTGTVTLSPFSASAFFNTLACSGNLCGVPTGLFANNITSTSVTLHWNSTGATNYKVRYRPAGTTAWTVKGAATNSKNLTGLVPATAYQWQVRSRCVSPNGTITFSAWSPTSVFQTLGATTCATPTGLTAVVNSANTALLAWNSTGATSYNIRYKPSNTAAWTNTTSNTNSKSLSGLSSGTAYEWQVQGVCAANGTITLSAWSASSFFTTNAPLSIAPNPAADKITVTYESTVEQKINLMIRDFLGNSYSAETILTGTGSNQYEMNVSSLKNGIYYLELTGIEGHQTMKFYVQH